MKALVVFSLAFLVKSISSQNATSKSGSDSESQKINNILIAVFVSAMSLIILTFLLVCGYIKCFKAEKKFRLVNMIVQYTPPFIPKAPASEMSRDEENSVSGVQSNSCFTDDNGSEIAESQCVTSSQPDLSSGADHFKTEHS